MSGELQERIKQQKFESPAQEALLSLLVAAASVRERIEDVCGEYGISSSQYNVLRILAGAPPAGYPRCEIIERMMDRRPDVTRLTDRLVRKDLVRRERSQEDRRMMMHRITEKGRSLLSAMADDIESVQACFSDRLSREEQTQLSRLCAAIYSHR